MGGLVGFVSLILQNKYIWPKTTNVARINHSFVDHFVSAINYEYEVLRHITNGTDANSRPVAVPSEPVYAGVIFTLARVASLVSIRSDIGTQNLYYIKPECACFRLVLILDP